ncbi:MAG: hypothetical protein SVV03_05870 [Candidatus Nanohaloarchaea archaeon]|nr:hypothetical protein [Candidatus Nanohaloarchaea archaeon]
MDIAVAVIALFWPFRLLLIWAVIWAFATGAMRPVSGGEFLEFLERWAYWIAPLALLHMQGWPRKLKDLFSAGK